MKRFLVLGLALSLVLAACGNLVSGDPEAGEPEGLVTVYKMPT